MIPANAHSKNKINGNFNKSIISNTTNMTSITFSILSKIPKTFILKRTITSTTRAIAKSTEIVPMVHTSKEYNYIYIISKNLLKIKLSNEIEI